MSVSPSMPTVPGGVSPTHESGPFAGLVSPFRRCFLSYTCKKPYTFTHFFKIRWFLEIQAKRGVILRVVKRYCTLLGGKTHSGWGGNTVARIRRAVLGLHRDPGDLLFSPNSGSVNPLSLGKRSDFFWSVSSSMPTVPDSVSPTHESGPFTGLVSPFRRCFLSYTCKKPYTFTHFY